MITHRCNIGIRSRAHVELIKLKHLLNAGAAQPPTGCARFNDRQTAEWAINKALTDLQRKLSAAPTSPLFWAPPTPQPKAPIQISR